MGMVEGPLATGRGPRAALRLIRSTLGMSATADTATNADFDRIDPFDQQDLEALDLREVNPFTIRVIKRSRISP